MEFMDFQSFRGRITSIENFLVDINEDNPGCYKLFSVEDGKGAIVNFVVMPRTYFVDHIMLHTGDMVTGFYDANAAAPLIYPPRFRAIVMAKDSRNYSVKVSYFNEELISSDGALKLNITPSTQLMLENGQRFTGSPANRNLIVIYGSSTRSIPAQTTPYRIIVMC